MFHQLRMILAAKNYLFSGCTHVLGDWDSGEVEEGNGEDEEGEQAAESARVRHLSESIWNTSESES